MNVYLICGFLLLFLFFVFMFFGVLIVIEDGCWLVDYKLGDMIGGVLEFIVVFDYMSVVFFSMVLLISSCVFFYSVEYMGHDSTPYRFCFLVLLFVMSMGVVIFSSNLVSILLGWDGLGLVSYVLVIYYQNNRSLNAGMMTILFNRVGDIGVLMGIVWMMGFGNWNYLVYVNLMDDVNVGLVGFFIVLSGLTKSAQIPFSSWLPAAMAAPTPVSALVHSSTLVTAGVFLLIRFGSYFLMGAFSWFLVIISGLTILMSGLCAMMEMDLKKVVALSTLSQLGFMMMILGVGCWWISFYHLLTHALFKSLLFLCAGYVICNYNSEQDFRGVGCLSNSPIVCCAFNVSLLSLAGFPFLSGYYSKDSIIEFFCLSLMGDAFILLMLLGVLLTTLYSLRLGMFCVWGDVVYGVGVEVKGGYYMEMSIVVLLIFAVVMGSVLSWWIFNVPVVLFMNMYIKLSGLMMVLLGVMIGWVLNMKSWGVIVSSFLLNFNSKLWFLSWMGGNGVSVFVDEGYSYYEYSWSEVIGSWGLNWLVMLCVFVLEWLSNNKFTLYYMFMILLLFVWLLM
uniref:NADH-ubiquinone oxidoreductase chain 5 n=1 Tax=Ricinoides karschii TaxID=1238228 RepID=W5R4P1_9ARAC|nr:NADH dehydrogenase subunit 5 [Ricinoides karschii]AGL11952.1 NADH dehydrogenase subunit 5 [Ricinoides karschii]